MQPYLSLRNFRCSVAGRDSRTHNTRKFGSIKAASVSSACQSTCFLMVYNTILYPQFVFLILPERDPPPAEDPTPLASANSSISDRETLRSMLKLHHLTLLSIIAFCKLGRCILWYIQGRRSLPT